MKFSELIDKVCDRGVVVAEIRAQSDPEIRGLCDDSRKARPGDLFVARSGAKTSGMQFIDEAFTRGAVAVVMQEDVGLPCAIAWARVANVNLACALLAHEVAGNPTAGMKMIAITGTKGKTTVAYLLRSVLKAAGHKVGMIGTVEIDDGEKTTPADMTTPGSVELVELFSRMKKNGVTHCVMEVSSHALHQHRVAGIDFAVAIFTNLTGDHLDYHKTMEEYAAAKAMLFEGLHENAIAIVNADDKWVQRILQRCKAKHVSFSVAEGQWDSGPVKTLDLGVLSVGLGGHRPQKTLQDSCWEAQIEEMTPGLMVTWIVGHEIRTRLTSMLIGRHNAANLIAVFAASKELGVDPGVICRTLKFTKGAPGRLQSVFASDGRDPGLKVFVDYAHTHDALENVLSALRATLASGESAKQSRDREGATELASQAARSLPHGRGSDVSPRLICLFGCGGDRDRTKHPKMAAIAERLADQVIVTSDNPRTENPAAIIEEICTGFSPNWQSDGKITIEPDRRAAIHAAIAAAQPGDVVLLAGKGHENYQIIGTTKHHFDDVEEAQNALRELNLNRQDTKAQS